jgi:hypothetical protein
MKPIDLEAERTSFTLSAKRLMFQFDSEEQWVRHAPSWFKQSGVRRGHWLCVDTRGRLCPTGAEFERATKEGTYPIKVYEI